MNHVYLVTVRVKNNGTSVDLHQKAFRNISDAKAKEKEYLTKYKSSDCEVYSVDIRCLRIN